MATKTRRKKKSTKKKTSVFQKSDEIYQRVTDRLIEALENGTRPWIKPWIGDPNAGFPTNIQTKKEYRGVNPWMLNLAAMENNYTSKYWGTFKQWSNKNGKIIKGQKSKVFVVFWKNIEFDDVDSETGQVKINEETGLPKKKKIFYLRHSPVYNLDQIENAAGKTTLDKYRINKECSIKFNHESYQPAEDIINNSGAKIVYGGDQAYCSKLEGEVHCPPKEKFPKLERFYNTMFHELCHYVEKDTGFFEVEDKSYALGELVAEIGSCYISERIGVPVENPDKKDEQAAAYVNDWLRALKNDRKFIFVASKWATEASNKLLGIEDKDNE